MMTKIGSFVRHNPDRVTPPPIVRFEGGDYVIAHDVGRADPLGQVGGVGERASAERAGYQEGGTYHVRSVTAHMGLFYVGCTSQERHSLPYVHPQYFTLCDSPPNWAERTTPPSIDGVRQLTVSLLQTPGLDRCTLIYTGVPENERPLGNDEQDWVRRLELRHGEQVERFEITETSLNVFGAGISLYMRPTLFSVMGERKTLGRAVSSNFSTRRVARRTFLRGGEWYRWQQAEGNGQHMVWNADGQERTLSSNALVYTFPPLLSIWTDLRNR